MTDDRKPTAYAPFEPEPKTSPDNAKPEKDILSEFIGFSEAVLKKLDDREERMVLALNALGTTLAEHYTREGQRNDFQDRRLDRLERAAGLEPLEK